MELIANAAVGLAAALSEVLNLLARSESVLPEQREAARVALQDAQEIWARYGGDGGGW